MVIKQSLMMFVVFTVFCGIGYPLAVTAIAAVAFPFQAQGSMIELPGSGHASEIIGQQFVGERYFWGRPSATSQVPYNSAASSGSNLGPTNPQLQTNIREQVSRYTSDQQNLPPIDLVTSSGSGLDPHISPESAFYQASRIAVARQMPLARVAQIIQNHTEHRQLGLLGEPRVNVLRLNLALDKLKQ